MEIFLVAVIIVAILFSEAHRSKNKKHKDRENIRTMTEREMIGGLIKNRASV